MLHSLPPAYLGGKNASVYFRPHFIYFPEKLLHLMAWPTNSGPNKIIHLLILSGQHFTSFQLQCLNIIRS